MNNWVLRKLLHSLRVIWPYAECFDWLSFPSYSKCMNPYQTVYLQGLWWSRPCMSGPSCTYEELNRWDLCGLKWRTDRFRCSVEGLLFPAIRNEWTHIKLYMCKGCVGQGHVYLGPNLSMKNLIIDIFVAQSDRQTDLDTALTDFRSPPIFLLFCDVSLVSIGKWALGHEIDRLVSTQSSSFYLAALFCECQF